jgi:two-component system, chemotaxis family, chemotaxis protein CheY
MKHRIMVVDDSFYMRTILKNMLSDAGFNVVGEAPDGKTAISLAKESNPDLITLDLILPDNTGLDVLKSIKQDNPNIKVVIVSAVGQEAIVKEALDQGAEAYIVKPFAEEKVIEIINNAIDGVRTVKQN